VRPTGPVTAWLDGREILVACSNDYLGLAWHPEVRDAARGGGAGASRLIGGSRPAHHALEEELQAIHGRPALVFPSGYQANLAVFSTVCQAGDLVASDALAHASIIDGLRLSKAQRLVVPHADPAAVPAWARLIAVEGLYSMDGDVPPLARYPRGPWLAVDEAHALGCLGPQGRGAADAAMVLPDILVGTFGKAYGVAGAFVVGPPELKELLVNTGRSFIYTTAMPEPVARMALAGLRLATFDARLREQLADRSARLRKGLADLGWKPLGSAHIVPVVVGPAAMDLAARLLARGVLAPGIRAPTVAAGQERVRFTVSACHTDEHLDRILDALGPRSSDPGYRGA
jgi:7-keto-8-aminopelargonate synthetase-like enzyme